MASGLKELKDLTQQLNLRDAELRMLKFVVEGMDDIVIITDHEAIITYVNKAFVKQTGYGKREVIGKNPSILKSGEMKKSFFVKLWKTLMDGKPFKGEFINKKKNGDVYKDFKTLSPIKNSKGKVVYFVSIGKTISK